MILDASGEEVWAQRCHDCLARISPEHARFFAIHTDHGVLRCAKCHHRRKADNRPTVTIPAWVADEIVCLLGLADGLADLTRRTSKEIGCQCGKEEKDEHGNVIDEISLCIYHHAQDVQHRASDVLDWLEQAGVPRRGS